MAPLVGYFAPGLLDFEFLFGAVGPACFGETYFFFMKPKTFALAILAGSNLACSPSPEAKQPPPKVCTMVLLPPTPQGPEKITYLNGTRWQPGQTLRVKFLGGNVFLQGKVRECSRQWFQHCHLKLEFVAKGDAEIRVHFLPSGRWSMVGRQSLTHSLNPTTLKPYRSSTGVTMNFDLTEASPEIEIRGLVLHEFGHALGLVHEHQSPASGIAWQRDSVYAYYKRLKWTKKNVDDDILNRYVDTVTQFTAYDKLSIMNYPIPADLLTDASQVVEWPNSLSATDITFIGRIYPPPVLLPK